jgi:ATP-dependent Clp protease, protease subunit
MAAANTLPVPSNRSLYLSKQVDQASMNELTKSIIEINENDEHLQKLYGVYGFEYKARPIKIYIDSYGGAVYQCFGLIGVMENSKTPIHTIVTGAAMSCGFMILINGHRRFAYRHATPLYHQVSSGFFGKVKDLEEKLEETKRLQEKIEEMTLRLTSVSKKKLREILKNKVDWFMTAESALELGVIDEIV